MKVFFSLLLISFCLNSFAQKSIPDYSQQSKIVQDQLNCLETYEDVVLQAQNLALRQSLLFSLSLDYKKQHVSWRNIEDIRDDRSGSLIQLKESAANLLNYLSYYKRDAFIQALTCAHQQVRYLPEELSGAVSEATQDFNSYNSKKFFSKLLHDIKSKEYINEREQQEWSTKFTLNLWHTLNSDLEKMLQSNQKLDLN